MAKKIAIAMLCSWLLVCMTPAAEAAGATTPMLGQVMVKGRAKINGTATSSGTTLFSGDQVTTEPNSVAELVLNGGNKVVLPESSAIILGNEGSQITVELKQGSLAALSKSSAPTLIDANGARIKPAADSAIVLEVAVLGRSLKVLSRRGTATVETVDKTLEVEEGKELDATMAPVPAQGPQGVHVAAKGKLETWVFITAVAAGITGLVFGIMAISRPNPTDCTFVSTTGKIVCP